jgi:hypothetical protein
MPKPTPYQPDQGNADPHPPEERHPYDERKPGGATTRRDTNRVNNAAHPGEAPPPPRNAENSSNSGTG